MLVKWNPFASGIARSAVPVTRVDDLFRQADRLLEGAFLSPSAWASGVAPPSDIRETQDAIVLTMDLPGFDPKTLDVQVEGDVLTVRAQRNVERADKGTFLQRERQSAEIARSFVLPRTVDASKCEARSEHGVLTVTLPKREEAKPRSITVSIKN